MNEQAGKVEVRKLTIYWTALASHHAPMKHTNIVGTDGK